MLTLVELHRIQKKCSVKNNKMKRLGNMNFLLEAYNFKVQNNYFKSQARAPPIFQCVHKTIQKQSTLGQEKKATSHV